jgi:hypothetical protein
MKSLLFAAVLIGFGPSSFASFVNQSTVANVNQSFTALFVIDGSPLPEVPVSIADSQQKKDVFENKISAGTALTLRLRNRGVVQSLERLSKRPESLDATLRLYTVKSEGEAPDVQEVKLSGLTLDSIEERDGEWTVRLRVAGVFTKYRAFLLLWDRGRTLDVSVQTTKLAQGLGYEITGFQSPQLRPGTSLGRRGIAPDREVAILFNTQDEALADHLRATARRGRPVDLEFMFFPDGPVRPYFEFLKVRLRTASVEIVVVSPSSTGLSGWEVRIRGKNVEVSEIKD